jgi:hypothetical protein
MGKLRRRKGRTASPRNPETGEKLNCKILDEVWAIEPEAFPRRAPKRGQEGWRQAAFVAELLEWDGTTRIRITYWQRRPGSRPNDWSFGGQYAPMMRPDEYRALMRKLRCKHW